MRRWAIVTSCGRKLASALIAHAGLPAPDVVVSADDVPRTKPAPDCYLEAARRLETEPGGCLVVEDSHGGVRAAVLAGMDVVAITRGRPVESGGGARDVGALREICLRFEDESGVIVLE